MRTGNGDEENGPLLLSRGQDTVNGGSVTRTSLEQKESILEQKETKVTKEETTEKSESSEQQSAAVAPGVPITENGRGVTSS